MQGWPRKGREGWRGGGDGLEIYMSGVYDRVEGCLQSWKREK